MNSEFRGSSRLKEGFKHCYAIEHQVLGWICVDPNQSNLFACILPAKFESDVMGEYKKLNPDATILHLHVRAHQLDLYPARAILSCVSAMQYLLGIHWRSVLTPWQLYNKIKANPPKHIEIIP